MSLSLRYTERVTQMLSQSRHGTMANDNFQGPKNSQGVPFSQQIPCRCNWHSDELQASGEDPQLTRMDYIKTPLAVEIRGQHAIQN
jgi:beta-galactosidase GanA